jgi:hypothetical protein
MRYVITEAIYHPYCQLAQKTRRALLRAALADSICVS